MPYIGRPLQAGVRRRYIYAATAGQTSFSGNDSSGISLAYDDNLFLDVYQNGVLLKPVTDYAATTGTSVVLTTGASTDDVLEMLVFDTFGVADTVSAANGGSFGSAVSFGGGATFPDSAELAFGASSDFKISHNGSKTKLEDTGTGNLEIRGTNIEFYSGDGGEALAKFIDDGAVELYHNNTKRIETTSTGASVTGALTTTAGATVADGDLLLDGDSPEIIFQTGASNYNWMIAAQENVSNALEISSGSQDGDYSNDTWTTRLVINNSGVVMIGTTDTSPFNNTSASGITLSATDIQIASGSTESLYLNRYGSDGRVVSIRKGGSFIGGIDVSTSQVTYNQTSDYRLKENVSYSWDATTRLKQLKPARFNYIVDADNTVDGFLAHEVESIVPQAITGTKDAMMDEEYEVSPEEKDADGNVTKEAVMGTRSVIDPQCIDHSKLVPLLVKTIQELEARIAALENE